MSQLRLLMATDIPFWRSTTGAEQRILHLVLALSKLDNPRLKIKTFYVGPTVDRDESKVDAHALDVDFRSSDQVPSGLARTLRWHFDGIVNLAKQSLANNDPALNESRESQNPVQLRDFRWPWALDAFKETVTSFEPNIFLSQYITMSYLLDALTKTQRASIHCAVDTHDVLSARAQQFSAHGYQHWLDIDQTQESNALSKFDSVWAIHESERSVFQEMAPNAQVVVAGHSIEPLLQANNREPSPQKEHDGKESSKSKLTIGYLGSNNRSNSHAVIEFIREAWQSIQEKNADIHFVIAGGICDFFDQEIVKGEPALHIADSNIRPLGRIDDLDLFYDQVDIVVNPVSFGTGLKIKNCEALAFGKPSLVTSDGFEALPSKILPATIVVKSVSEMVKPILELAGDLARVQDLQKTATEVGKTKLTDCAIYQELFDVLRSHSRK